MLSGVGKTTFVGGPAGPANVLSIRNVTTGLPGSLAAALISGIAPNQVLDLTIPQGPIGPTGPVPWAPLVTWAPGLICVASAPATAVVYGNEAYVCVISHIAGTFAPDFASGRWLKVTQKGVDGTNGVPPWQTPPVPWAASTAYTATAPVSSVTYQGGSYVCSTNHTSGATFDITKWTQIAAPGQTVGSTLVQPQGRLTLTSGTPALSAAVSGATSVFYTPAVGNLVPLWNGAAFVMTAFAEVSQALSDSTKSPSAAVAGQVYDLFAWLDGSTVRVTRGPTWSAGAAAGSNSARGSGAGSSALTRVAGLLVNAAAIANGPAAGYGTYVGTIMTDAGGATVSFSAGSAAVGGGAAWIGLWNAYNRVPVSGQVRDTTSSWTYATAAWRAANNSATMRVTAVAGLSEDVWEAEYMAVAASSAAGFSAGVGVNTTGNFTGLAPYLSLQSIGSSTAKATFTPLGVSYASAVEHVYSGGSTTFYGNGISSGIQIQSGLTFRGRY